MAFLECRDLKRVFPGKFALSLSLEVKKGELLCLIGPSGSGKSTLLSLICGIDRPDSGRILIDGRDITDLEIRKRNIGMVFQDYSLFPSMSVGENIRYGMKETDRTEREQKTAELLDLVGLPGYEKRSVHELSGGEAQRIALARAIAARPDILLLDEPLSSLDAPLRRRLRTVIRQIHDETGITMMYVTHDREEAFAIADRIVVMKGGRICACGDPESIYRRPSDLFTAFFTGDGSAIPMSYLTGSETDFVAFFRPEDIEIDARHSSDKYYTLKDAVVESCEFTGSLYIVRLSYKGSKILVHSDHKPSGQSVTLCIPRDRILEMKDDLQ